MNNVIHCQIKAKKFSMVFFMAIFLTLLLDYSNGVYADQIIPEQKQNLQQDSTFSVNLKNSTIKEILYEIQRKTGYSFMFEQEELGKIRKSINLVNTTLKACLDKLFEQTPYIYEINGKTIAIVKKNTKNQENKCRVKGKITDESGEAVIGATILIEGTSIGTATDVNGEFQLEVSAGETLQISFLGMQSQKYHVTQSTDQLLITLKSDVKAMEEVIVTGMFTRKAESFTGSAKTITAKELERVGNGNLFQSLRNLDPSLNIMDNLEFPTCNYGEPPLSR